jgi:hypothetical protein
MHLDSSLLVANGAPRDRRTFWLWQHGIAVQWYQPYEALVARIHISAAMPPWTFLIKLYQGPLIILDQSTISTFRCLSPLLSGGRTLLCTLPCGNHDRTEHRDPGGLLEGMGSAEEVQRSRQVLAQISLAEIVLLCCFLLPLLALEVEFLVSQQCLTSFMAIRPM